MLDRFGDGLKNTFRKIAGMGMVNKEAVEAVMRELQRTLLAADVDVRLVYEMSKRVKEEVLGGKTPPGMTVKEHFLKILYEEMTNLLGKEKGSLEVGKQRILLIGLFGSGKTTTAGKLARWFKVRGLSAALIACDTHRAAAQEQLRQIGKKLDVPVYSEGKKPEDIARNGTMAKEGVLIFDSAGRDALDGELARELKEMGKIIRPDEVILVIPADLGQAARKQAEEFNRLVGITGIIVTKLDGTAKGGGSLAASSVSGSPIKFIGTGEKPEDLEEYDPKRFVGRLIGYGDIHGLLEKAKEAGIERTAKNLMESGKFTMNDFYEQIGSLQKMGSLQNVMNMIPGLSSGPLAKKIPKDFMDVQEGKMKRWKYAIDSMTPKEREDPESIKQARIERIAKGSGIPQSEVRELLKYYKQVNKMIRMTGGGKAFRRGPFAKIAKQLGMDGGQ